MATLWQTLCDWWAHDRVRASPREGALLRLTPGSCLVIGGQSAVITARQAVETDGGMRLLYTCDVGVGSGVLGVGPVNVDLPLAVEWEGQPLDADAIVIYPAGNRQRVG